MSLDIVDTIKSTFGRFKTGAGLGVLGIVLVLGLLGLGFTFVLPDLVSMGGAGILAAGIAAVVMGIIGLVVTVGAIRSLESGSLDVENFTSNVVRPSLSYIGAYIVIAVFTFIALIIGSFAIGAVAVVLAQLGVVEMIGISTLMSLAPTLGAIAAGVAGLFALYPLLTLSISVPRIAVDDERMFEALDNSVVTTSGSKLAMFLASLPILVLYIVNRATANMAVPSSQMAGTTGQLGAQYGSQMPSQSLSSMMTPELGPAIVMIVVGAFFTTSLYSFLVELNQRLPE
ncbi:MAG: hypothetical protein H8Z69_02005 [Nanohaloarchaea archaeon]|nr:hypothetical protein [Candidatus Nanohaloarchaea archaeon]